MVGQPDRKPKVDTPGHVVLLFCDEWEHQATAQMFLGGWWPMKLDDKKIHTLALEVTNPRMTRQEQAKKLELGRLGYWKDFKRRALFGEALTLLEAKVLVREQLTWDHWQVNFYEVVQFPHARFFLEKAEAMEYFRKATEERGGLNPQRMEVYKPKEKLFDKRKVEIEWKAKGYTPDPLTLHYR